MKSNRTVALAGWLIALAVAAVYCNSLDGPFLFDDSPAIVSNKTIRHLWPLSDALSPPNDGSSATGRPLFNLSLALNYAVGELDVRGYHVTNVVMHLLVTLILWGILRRTLRRIGSTEREKTDAEIMAWIATLLWAVHPLLTESVTCVVQRNEVMGALFYLLTLYCFIRATSDETGAPATTTDATHPPTGLWAEVENGRRRWENLAVLACLVGVTCKETLATAPLLVLLYDRTFVAGTFRGAWVRRKLFYLKLVSSWILLGWLMISARQRGGTVGFGLGVSSWDYLLTQSRALVIYLKLCFWPHPLVIDYGVEIIRQVKVVWWQGLVIVTLLGITGFALGRKPRLGFLGAAFFVILAPSSSFVPLVSQTMAEHRMYLPLAAVVILVVVALFSFLGRGALVCGVMLALVLGVGTVRRNRVFNDDLTVWTSALQALPDNARAYSGIGTAYFRHGNWVESARNYQRSLDLAPNSGQVQYNLALALDRMGQNDQAIGHYLEAVRLSPHFAAVRADLGALLLKVGRTSDAIAQLKQSLADDPDEPETCNNLGMALAQAGRVPEAIEAYGQALKLVFDLANVHFNLGLALISANRPKDAIAQYTEAARLDPKHAEAHMNLGVLLAQANRPEEALMNLRLAVGLKRNWPEAHANLGMALARAGRVPEAVRSYEEALRLRPDYALAHYNLGHLLLQSNQWDEARFHFAEAVRLAPDFEAARLILEKIPAKHGRSP